MGIIRAVPEGTADCVSVSQLRKEIDTYEKFIKEIKKRLSEKGLPMPVFIVGQTGTLVESTIQAGSFNFSEAKELSDIAAKYGVFLKEHNADYLDEASLLMHIPTRVAAANVAPQFGMMETQALLALSEVEQKLFAKGQITNKSDIYKVLLESAVKTGRWKKWVSEEKARLSFDEIIKNQEFSREVLDIAGHYTLNETEVKRENQILYDNLGKFNINCDKFIREHIETAIFKYVQCFNMENTI